MILSIIVPVYNVKDYVIKCLDSIYNQTIYDYEVIVVDDGSTDGSDMIVDAYCENKPKFHVYHKENGGLMSAWMLGVTKASGDYLGFVDSDDYVDKEMFKKLCDVAVKYDVDIVMCDRFDVVGNAIQKPVYDTEGLQEGLYSGADVDFIKKMVFPLKEVPEISKARWNKIFKRELYLANTKYCQCMSKTFEDRYITPSCIFSAKSIYYLKLPLYYYVHRDGSNSGMYKPDLLYQIKRLYDVEKQALIDKGIMEKYKDNWEYLFMDYIRQYVVRNIMNVKGFSVRVKSSKCLLQDDLVKKRIEKFGKEDETKMGKAVFWSFKLKMPLLLALTSYFG